MTNIPIQCQSCGATGEVLRVTANLQCRCGSTDLDLWDGETHTAASQQGHHNWLQQGVWHDEDDEPVDNGERSLADHVQHSYDTGYNRGRAGREPLAGFFGEHQDAHDLGHADGTRDRAYDQHRMAAPKGADNYAAGSSPCCDTIGHRPGKSGHFFCMDCGNTFNDKSAADVAKKKESAAKGPGTGWGQNQPDNASNWDEYAGPTPGANPKIREKNDFDDTHVCQVCKGTGKTMFGGGSYGEGICRNCHGTGKTVYTTENDTPSLDAHMPQGGSPLGAGANNGHFSAKAPVVVPGVKGNKVVTASQSDKIMAMAATIVANNSGLTTVEAFELARRAVASFPEDDA